MPILAAHWLSAVAVEGDDWVSVLQEVSNNHVDQCHLRHSDLQSCLLVSTHNVTCDTSIGQQEIRRAVYGKYIKCFIDSTDKSLNWCGDVLPWGFRKVGSNRQWTIRAFRRNILSTRNASRNLHSRSLRSPSPGVSFRGKNRSEIRNAAASRLFLFEKPVIKHCEAQFQVALQRNPGQVLGGEYHSTRTCGTSKIPSRSARRCSVTERLYCSPPTNANSVQSSLGPGHPPPPGFSQMGIVADDAAGRRVFSGISRFLRPCIAALLHPSPQFTVISSPRPRRKEPPKYFNSTL
ncbi:hypothetical protein PR048_022222 [Dryococelus australis]|uniref:Uncharacterized protein n=1 Tax=Dryococelus australis TaxID=614101 RepID=A0ABQ9H0H8_9NEOP|nr:hypothetical protein PR048_022222 [Dryococelus australis]